MNNEFNRTKTYLQSFIYSFVSFMGSSFKYAGTKIFEEKLSMCNCSKYREDIIKILEDSVERIKFCCQVRNSFLLFVKESPDEDRRPIRECLREEAVKTLLSSSTLLKSVIAILKFESPLLFLEEIFEGSREDLLILDWEQLLATIVDKGNTKFKPFENFVNKPKEA